MILMLMVKHSQNPQNSKFAMFLQYLKKEDMKLIFCMQINIKVSHKLISTLWGSKFPRWYYYYWWAWSSILKVFKLRSLQYLCNISKKKLVMEFIFCMQINIKVSKSWHYWFWWKWPDMSKVPKIGRIFLQYIKIKVLQLLLCSVVMQNIQILYRGPGMFVFSCFFLKKSMPENHHVGVYGIIIIFILFHSSFTKLQKYTCWQVFQ